MLDEGSVAGLVTDDDLVRRSFQRRRPSDARVDPGLSPPVLPTHPDRAGRHAVAVSHTHAIGRRPLVRDTQSVDRFSIDASTAGIRKACAATVSPVTAEVASARVAPPSGDRRGSAVIEPASLVHAGRPVVDDRFTPFLTVAPSADPVDGDPPTTVEIRLRVRGAGPGAAVRHAMLRHVARAAGRPMAASPGLRTMTWLRDPVDGTYEIVSAWSSQSDADRYALRWRSAGRLLASPASLHVTVRPPPIGDATGRESPPRAVAAHVGSARSSTSGQLSPR